MYLIKNNTGIMISLLPKNGIDAASDLATTDDGPNIITAIES